MPTYTDNNHGGVSIPWNDGNVNLGSDPMIAPQPIAMRIGQIGAYSYSTGQEEFEYDGTVWQPTTRPRRLMPPPISTLTHFLLADDIDGNQTFNSAYSDGDLIPVWTNAGGTGSNGFTNLNYGNGAVTAGYRYVLNKRGLSGRGTVVCPGITSTNSSYIQLTGSASQITAIHQTGIFEAFFVVNWYGAIASTALFGCSSDGAHNGGEVTVNTSGNVVVIFSQTGQNNGFLTTSTTVLTPNQAALLLVRGDGTNVYFSLNGGTEESIAFAHTPTGTGNASHDFQLGAAFPDSGNVLDFSGEIGLFAFFNGALTIPQRKNFIQDIRRVYGL